MTERSDVVGEWVEIAEKGGEDRMVFLRNGSDIPPARGRRTLELEDQGLALGGAPGPSDKTEPTGQGGWMLEGETLTIRLPGWEGTYEVETAQDDELILRKR